MKVYLKSFLFFLVVVVICFVAASLLDIFLAAMYSRGYSKALFIVIFGVAGIFAGFTPWGYALDQEPETKKTMLWLIPVISVLIGLLFIFFLAPLEGGEYESAFASFGVTLAATGVFTWFQKKDA